MRLENILSKKIKVTEYDRIFYTHELQEFKRYRNLGVKDGINESEILENCHAATLEDFKINEKTTSVYHPDNEPGIEELLNKYD